MPPTNAFDVFAQLDPPLWLVTCQTDQARGGLIATFVAQASIVPTCPRVVVGIAQQHHTWHLIEAKQSFVLHLLGEEQLPLVWQFGLTSGHDEDKLANMETEISATGNPRLPDCLGYLDCRVETALSTGDRTLYLADVVDAAVLRPQAPLTLQRLLTLAPDDKKRELKTQMQRDQKVDADLITAFRSRQQT